MGYLWRPPRDLVDQANVTSFMEEHGFKSYRELVDASIRRLRWWWGNLPEWLGVEWFREPREVVDLSRGPEWARWYVGGRLNAAYNVVDVPAEKYGGSREAFTWVGEDGSARTVTYGELRDMVWRFASFLREEGVGKGDVVAIYAPMLPESVAAMLAAMEIGAVAAPIFSGFAPPAVAQRLEDSGAKVLVTVDGYLRRGRRIILKPNADEARRLAGGTPERVVVIRRLNADIPWDDSVDISWDDAINGKRPVAEPEETEAEDPALLLYTSGTTGEA